MLNRKPIFDAFRRILARGFTAREVRMIDEAIDRALKETGEQLAKESGQVLRTSTKGVALMHEFEGCELKAYPDPGTGGDPITIGWGTTRINGKPIPRGLQITQETADKLFRQDLERYEAEVRKAIGTAPTTQSQFDALVSFHYNTGAIGKATLTRLHRGGEHDKAANEFLKWKFAGGRVMNGLLRRRKAERELYLS